MRMEIEEKERQPQRKLDRIVKKALVKIDNCRMTKYNKCSMVDVAHDVPAETTLQQAREWEQIAQEQEWRSIGIEEEE
jgi:predicted Co/Zn/Cd cation transporter (cation efflux family)